MIRLQKLSCHTFYINQRLKGVNMYTLLFHVMLQEFFVASR
uniref:Uncharacterized protein n=1 Tax=Arundo donax TaxID=35708 RepID=A0A0A8ZWE7_ARUDO